MRYILSLLFIMGILFIGGLSEVAAKRTTDPMMNVCISFGGIHIKGAQEYFGEVKTRSKIPLFGGSYGDNQGEKYQESRLNCNSAYIKLGLYVIILVVSLFILGWFLYRKYKEKKVGQLNS